MTDTSFNPETGEILDHTEVPRGVQKIGDSHGVTVPRQGRDVASVIAMLEDGEFNADVAVDMRDLVSALEVHAHNNKGVAKGKLTIELDLTLANGVFVLVGNHKVKKPVAKRIGTALFAREDGGLGRNPGGQYQTIGHQSEMRDTVIDQPVRDHETHRPVRDI